MQMLFSNSNYRNKNPITIECVFAYLNKLIRTNQTDILSYAIPPFKNCGGIAYVYVVLTYYQSLGTTLALSGNCPS